MKHSLVITLVLAAVGCGSQGAPATDSDRQSVDAIYRAAQEKVREKLGDNTASFPMVAGGHVKKIDGLGSLEFESDSLTVTLSHEPNLSTKRVDKWGTVSGFYRSPKGYGSFKVDLDQSDPTGQWRTVSAKGVEIEEG